MLRPFVVSAGRRPESPSGTRRPRSAPCRAGRRGRKRGSATVRAAPRATGAETSTGRASAGGKTGVGIDTGGAAAPAARPVRRRPESRAVEPQKRGAGGHVRPHLLPARGRRGGGGCGALCRISRRSSGRRRSRRRSAGIHAFPFGSLRSAGGGREHTGISAANSDQRPSYSASRGRSPRRRRNSSSPAVRGTGRTAPDRTTSSRYFASSGRWPLPQASSKRSRSHRPRATARRPARSDVAGFMAQPLAPQGVDDLQPSLHAPFVEAELSGDLDGFLAFALQQGDLPELLLRQQADQMTIYQLVAQKRLRTVPRRQGATSSSTVPQPVRRRAFRRWSLKFTASR